MKKLKEEKGSMSLFVIVSMLFFVLFLTGVYMLSSLGQQRGISETAKIKEIYEKDVNQVDDIYETLTADVIIPDKSGANIPNLKRFAQKTFVTWKLNEDGTEYVINDSEETAPADWYDYDNGNWANIKTTNKVSNTETLELIPL